MSKNEDLAQEAVDVGTCLLKALHEFGTDPLTSQAALGIAWYRLCKGMEYPPETFWEMCNGMGKMYEESVNHGPPTS